MTGFFFVKENIKTSENIWDILVYVVSKGRMSNTENTSFLLVWRIKIKGQEAGVVKETANISNIIQSTVRYYSTSFLLEPTQSLFPILLRLY